MGLHAVGLSAVGLNTVTALGQILQRGQAEPSTGAGRARCRGRIPPAEPPTMPQPQPQPRPHTHLGQPGLPLPRGAAEPGGVTARAPRLLQPG